MGGLGAGSPRILLCEQTRRGAEAPKQLCCALAGVSSQTEGSAPAPVTARPARSRHEAARACRAAPPEPEVTRAARRECASGSPTACASHRGSRNPDRWLSRQEEVQIQLRGHLGVFPITSWETSNLHPSAFLHPLEPGTVDRTRIWGSPGPQRQLYCWGGGPLGKSPSFSEPLPL